jgi:hypothetical protein
MVHVMSAPNQASIQSIVHHLTAHPAPQRDEDSPSTYESPSHICSIDVDAALPREQLSPAWPPPVLWAPFLSLLQTRNCRRHLLQRCFHPAPALIVSSWSGNDCKHGQTTHSESVGLLHLLLR